MVFDSLKAVEERYKMYARRYGFGIRYDYKRKSEVDGEISSVSIVCHRAGVQSTKKKDTWNPEPVVKLRGRNITERTGCKARMMIKRRPDGWLVTEFAYEYNHPLIKKWSLTRYTVKNVANYRASIQMEHKYTDMEDTMDYFRKLQQQDKDFYYKYKLDEEFRVQNIFWVDGAARRAYKHYNDCVSFDTTYMTNIYKMPFAPFIGINNHGQSIQFGCGFLRNELTERFVWLFRTFLEAVDGLVPINIITDQDFAMRAGIDEVFPNTRHRNCRWHIMKKATEKLGSYLAGRKKLHAEFNDSVNSSMTPDEFEEKWNTMVQKHRLEEHEDFIRLYHKRSCCVPAYFMQSFYPFLQSTARNEGFNAVLKK
ncbi:hypothetical protein BRADI_4g31777v3 [Brachypodium distachyon]|uniref:Uncharacterized protein n=1 Tax=Brachypodium distachyon TaxID=15368 RepID=A0A2K2CRP2_BRADI|nr:hypothetical protein BRADI_4g31777v3 [Brachypodium distachyon]